MRNSFIKSLNLRSVVSCYIKITASRTYCVSTCDTLVFPLEYRRVLHNVTQPRISSHALLYITIVGKSEKSRAFTTNRVLYRDPRMEFI